MLNKVPAAPREKDLHRVVGPVRLDLNKRNKSSRMQRRLKQPVREDRLN